MLASTAAWIPAFAEMTAKSVAIVDFENLTFYFLVKFFY